MHSIPGGVRIVLMAGFATLTTACGSLPEAPVSPAETTEAAILTSLRDRLPQDEVIYFVLPDRFENGDPSNDRGGIPGDRLDHGFDPSARGFYHGGDLRGLTDQLEYIQGLGATAIWLGPIYQNKAVQGPPGQESAGYHGYWITDFTRIDRHYGTEAEMTAFSDAVHRRGMKLYLDIITNHTADVIQYRECADPEWPEALAAPGCPYRALADFPYTTRGDRDAPAINPGFMGHLPPFQTRDNFAKLTDPAFAYTPFLPKGEEQRKAPAWLNDLRYYHNRGNSTFEAESSTLGDFAGLDDVMTEHPDVVAGFIDIYADWIRRYRIDGFRIDTAKHVNEEFWRAFNPAMLETARRAGIPNFTIFGESMHVGDPAWIARYTREGAFPTMLDFGFQHAASRVIIHGDPAYAFTRFFAIDALYEGDAAYQAPTFVGNHDIGRFAGLLRAAHPNMPDDEMLLRVKLAHALMMFARGVPIIYYGDEQGFVSDGNDQLAREDMMPSRVAEYNDNDLLGTDATTAASNFDTQHPLYVSIAGMAQLRAREPALRRGVQLERLAEERGGVFAFSRVIPDQYEIVVIYNFRNETREIAVPVDARSTQFTALTEGCPETVDVTGSIELTLAPLSFVVCKSDVWKVSAE